MTQRELKREIKKLTREEKHEFQLLLFNEVKKRRKPEPGLFMNLSKPEYKDIQEAALQEIQEKRDINEGLRALTFKPDTRS